MTPPFSAEQFFSVFAAYNTGVWPAQLVLGAIAVAIVTLAFVGPAWRGRAILVALGILWIWMGTAYHWAYFAAINPAARVFGAAFVAEGLLLCYLGVSSPGPTFAPTRDPFGVVGGALVAYALVLYPLLGLAVGHLYPAQPTFGLPCPTTIFTLGILLWSRHGVAWPALVVPALWSVLGISAVVSFGVIEDAMLPIAGVLGTALILRKNRMGSQQGESGGRRFG